MEADRVKVPPAASRSHRSRSPPSRGQGYAEARRRSVKSIHNLREGRTMAWPRTGQGHRRYRGPRGGEQGPHNGTGKQKQEVLGEIDQSTGGEDGRGGYGLSHCSQGHRCLREPPGGELDHTKRVSKIIKLLAFNK